MQSHLPVTSPLPGNGQAAQVFQSLYDTLGRAWKTIAPDGGCVTDEFYLTGALKKTTGTRTYPVEYTYDTQVRMKTLKTWRNFASKPVPQSPAGIITQPVVSCSPRTTPIPRPEPPVRLGQTTPTPLADG